MPLHFQRVLLVMTKHASFYLYQMKKRAKQDKTCFALNINKKFEGSVKLEVVIGQISFPIAKGSFR